MKHDPGNAELGGGFDSPRVEHVGNDEVWSEVMEELFEARLENGETHVDSGGHLGRRVDVEGFDPRRKPHFGGGEVDQVRSDGAAATGVEVYGLLENGGVLWCGYYGDVYAMHGEEPGHVHQRDYVTS